VIQTIEELFEEAFARLDVSSIELATDESKDLQLVLRPASLLG
jgi:hypothetical protein